MTDKITNTFFQTLKEKVDHYFLDQKTERTGNKKLYIKSIAQFFTALLLYVFLVFIPSPPWGTLLLAALLGVNLAMLGFNIMHEGGHQSFSKHNWLNSLAGYCLNMLGGNIYFWKIKHNVNHHTYTNIEGVDSDIDVRPFMRLHPNQLKHAIHRYQHIYWFVLYGISYIAWVFYEDFVKYFRGKIAAHMKPMNLPVREHIIFWLTKIIYVILSLVLPIIFLGWIKAWVVFLVVTFVCGLFISIVFQLAHVVESTDFPLEKKIETEWAVHQINTTSNFAVSNKLLFWMLGGLNFQIEHHLFPKISHIHYPQINQLVKETCQEFNIVYREYTTMVEAFASHLLYLRKMGAIS
ncbi:MAG: acyl-CoA desaturase [Bacteroidetes bacterium]|nr:acyl-CoA desaturase [Bacteroidota bacterium]